MGVLWLFRSQLHSKTCFVPENCVFPVEMNIFFRTQGFFRNVIEGRYKMTARCSLTFFCGSNLKQRQILRRHSSTFGQLVRLNTNQDAEEVCVLASVRQVKRGQNVSAVRKWGSARSATQAYDGKKQSAVSKSARVAQRLALFFRIIFL